jgi:NDP-sugar pyrophosphorylase family protein
MSFLTDELIDGLPVTVTGKNGSAPWLITACLADALLKILPRMGAGYVVHNNVAIHETATVEPGAVLKGPAIIGPGCFIGANAYLRAGVYLGSSVVIGPGCEVKTSVIMSHTHIAHFNFVGDSLIGSHVNFEAGAIVCNHWNERSDKQIRLAYNGQIIETGTEKFGALIGDGCKIGANAVLSPGTILAKNTIVSRLELVEQNPG